MCEHFDKDYDDDYEEDENLDDDCEMEKRKLYDEEDDDIINFIDITPRFLPLFAEKFSFEYLRKSHKIPLFSNKLVTDYIRALTLACTAA